MLMSTVTEDPMVWDMGVDDGGFGGIFIREVMQVHFLVRKKLITSCRVIGSC